MRPNQTLRDAQGERRLGINAYLNDNVLRERFESLATGLSDGDRDVAGLAGIDVRTVPDLPLCVPPTTEQWSPSLGSFGEFGFMGFDSSSTSSGS